MAVRAVLCQLNGHEVALRLDLGAMAALEDMGYEVDTLIKDVAKGNFSPKRLQLLLWAMTQDQDTPPSLREVGRWVDGENFEVAALKIGEALRLSFPEPAKDRPPNPPMGAGTGEPLSASPLAPSGSP